ncbi:hypothetical protein AnaeK_3935 [Anaeromyxobacter sp. K]|uniref:hypothetical protein n=1 Tax=Anaeromyxobacter sp. (strain K) TaxID=447217 RepID=UPI00015F889C|nr:hypothetical protein [Anaeromyxobacter sp. K]ACG75142.1 hypothetical protein AnaeK_3935 [Anaeromyxobacter sp. K]
MSIAIRKLNEKGTAQFAAYVQEIRNGATAPPPLGLLEDPNTSLPVPGGAAIEPKTFPTRGDAAKYLVGALAKVPQAEVDHSPALWNWLSLYFFDQVCPPLASGKRKVLKQYHYVLPPVSDPEHFRHYYRHMLAGAFRIRRQHPSSGKVFLAGAPHKFDDFNEQVASRQELISNPAIVGALDVLYYDPAMKRPKRGAGSNKRKPGTLRRFVNVIQQLDLTYDLYSLSTDQLLDLLPREFDRWRGSEAEAA